MRGVHKVSLSLTLTGKKADAECLKELSYGFPDMEVLKILGIDVTDVSLLALLSCQALRSIHLLRCNTITGAGVVLLASRHTSLEQIQLCSCEHIVDGQNLDFLMQAYNIKARLSYRYW